MSNKAFNLGLLLIVIATVINPIRGKQLNTLPNEQDILPPGKRATRERTKALDRNNELPQQQRSEKDAPSASSESVLATRALLKDMVPGSRMDDGIWSRIIDGNPAPRNRWPWSVALDTWEYGWVCSGTLIGLRWVLAAAHCIDGVPVTVYARVGAWNLSAHDQKDTVSVEEIIFHPLFVMQDSQQVGNGYDIALLYLSRPANVSTDDVLTLPDPMFNLFTLNPFCYIIGWGVTDIGSGDTSDVLNEKSVNVITPVECQVRWNEAFTQPKVYISNLCVDQGVNRTISACHGDSGSPMQCYDVLAQKWKLAGFSSWGSNECHTYPSVYTRVQFFLSWIYSIVLPYNQRNS